MGHLAERQGGREGGELGISIVNRLNRIMVLSLSSLCLASLPVVLSVGRTRLRSLRSEMMHGVHKSSDSEFVRAETSEIFFPV